MTSVVHISAARSLERPNAEDYADHQAFTAALVTWQYDEIERLAARVADGHCRKCECDDCSRFYREIDRK